MSSLYGSSGDDIFLWDPSAETIFAGAGDDTINRLIDFGEAAQQPDVIYAGSGDDVLFTSHGPNGALFGGDGNDRFEIRGGSLDMFGTLEGGEGFDTLSLKRVNTMATSTKGEEHHVFWNISLDEGLTDNSQSQFLSDYSIPGVRFEVHSIERVIGSATSDMFFGSVADDRLYGWSGGDGLVGANGNDKLFGQDGNDFLMDGAGIDNLFGGAGADTFRLVRDGDVDSIKDFDPTEDTISLEWGVTSFDQLSVTRQVGGSGKVFIRFEDEVLAVNGRAEDRGSTPIDISDFTPDVFQFL